MSPDEPEPIIQDSNKPKSDWSEQIAVHSDHEADCTDESNEQPSQESQASAQSQSRSHDHESHPGSESSEQTCQTTSASVSQQKNAVIVLNRVLDAVKNKQIKLARNFRNESLVICSLPTFPELRTPITSQKFAEWIARFAFENFRMLLTTAEMKTIAVHLAGYALDAPQVPPELQEIDDLLESDPTFHTVVSFVDAMKDSTWEAEATKAFHDLQKHARINNLLKLRGRNFPGAANALSRRLRDLIAPLRSAGVNFIHKNKSRARIICFERTSASCSPADHASHFSYLPPEIHDEGSTKSAEELDLIKSL